MGFSLYFVPQFLPYSRSVELACDCLCLINPSHRSIRILLLTLLGLVCAACCSNASSSLAHASLYECPPWRWFPWCISLIMPDGASALRRDILVVGAVYVAHMWMVLLVQGEQSVESIALLLMGSTSDRQAGQWNVPSGRQRISGWPHSQACSPRASGRAAICSSVPTVASSKARQQDSHSAERENTPRVRSAPCPHAGQTRRSALETPVCLTEPLPVLVLPGGPS